MKEIIQKLEQELLNSDIRKSRSALENSLADSFMEIGSDGVAYNKKEIITDLLKETSETKWLISDFQIRILSPRIIQAIYHAAKTEMPANKPQISLRSSLWELIDSRWQMIFHQGTLVS